MGGRQPIRDLMSGCDLLAPEERSHRGLSWWLTRGDSTRATDQRQDTIPRPASVHPRPLPPLGLSLFLLLKNFDHEKSLCGAAEPTTRHTIMIATTRRIDTRICWRRRIGLLFRACCLQDQGIKVIIHNHLYILLRMASENVKMTSGTS